MAFLKFNNFRCEHEPYFVNTQFDSRYIVQNYRLSDSGCRRERDYSLIFV